MEASKTCWHLYLCVPSLSEDVFGQMQFETVAVSCFLNRKIVQILILNKLCYMLSSIHATKTYNAPRVEPFEVGALRSPFHWQYFFHGILIVSMTLSLAMISIILLLMQMMYNNPAWADNAQHRSDFKLEHMCDSGCQRCDLIQNVVHLFRSCAMPAGIKTDGPHNVILILPCASCAEQGHLTPQWDSVGFKLVRWHSRSTAMWVTVCNQIGTRYKFLSVCVFQSWPLLILISFEHGRLLCGLIFDFILQCAIHAICVTGSDYWISEKRVFDRSSTTLGRSVVNDFVEECWCRWVPTLGLFTCFHNCWHSNLEAHLPKPHFDHRPGTGLRLFILPKDHGSIVHSPSNCKLNYLWYIQCQYDVIDTMLTPIQWHGYVFNHINNINTADEAMIIISNTLILMSLTTSMTLTMNIIYKVSNIVNDTDLFAFYAPPLMALWILWFWVLTEFLVLPLWMLSSSLFWLSGTAESGHVGPPCYQYYYHSEYRCCLWHWQCQFSVCVQCVL